MPLGEPLRFVPQPHEKVWGGRRLWGVLPPAERRSAPLGEVWTLVDRPSVSAAVLAGRLKGRSLHDLHRSEPRALLGELAQSCQRFPLLVKLLDTSQNLSVQVHPDARAASELGAGAESKTECWYVLAAEPGAQIFLGLKENVDAACFRACAGTPAVIDLLRTWPVSPGQFFYVPPGTVHAIGAGITLVEIQNNSDTTYRLYDWGRMGLDGQPRPTHLEAALLSLRLREAVKDPLPPSDTPQGTGSKSLLKSPAFEVQELQLGERMLCPALARPRVYILLAGQAQLTPTSGAGTWALEPWQTWLMPADLGEHWLEPLDGMVHMLVVEPREEQY